jgi:cytochrome bd-type quinol oxidase subunit 1
VEPLSKALLLFVMNWLDAQLTILWVRLHVATEGNGIMAALLHHGENSFLSVKLLVGAVSAYILYRFAEIPLARRGMKAVLVLYVAIMIVHVVTGFSALGWHAPTTVLSYFANLPRAFVTALS